MAEIKQFVKLDTTPIYKTSTENKVVVNLLWGDMVIYDDTQDMSGERILVKARGREGFIKKSALGSESLLEIYFIDVGQGDGMLIKTPEGEHIMIDGGYKRRSQQSGKNAADFIDWKFFTDYGMDSIELDAIITSHNDADHYGGLWDLINPNEQHELNINTSNVNVKQFYHAGIAWFKKGNSRNLGPVIEGKLTLLVEDLEDIADLLDNERDGYKLQGEWADFMQCIVDKGIPANRISNKTALLSQFEKPDFSIKVLAPIETEHNGKPAYFNFGSITNYSQNSNGHSITLRIDYKSVKILLTGDLNTESQLKILEFYQEHNNISALACDVAKSCHHGSDDCSFEFLSHLSAGATIISSGDSEGHGHPRPSIVAASAITGHKLIKRDNIVTPLIFSTEISRSYKIGKPIELTVGQEELKFTDSTYIDVTYKETNAGDLNPSTKTKSFWDKKIVGGIIYGLVNVRTDGKTILCATLSEKDNKWDIKKFESRFN